MIYQTIILFLTNLCEDGQCKFAGNNKHLPDNVSIMFGGMDPSTSVVVVIKLFVSSRLITEIHLKMPLKIEAHSKNLIPSEEAGEALFQTTAFGVQEITESSKGCKIAFAR
jgi:hypothetical protein